ncbi:MAG: SMP-30/gluconolactonase/LRE family protein [Bauldia sp.]
MHRPPNIAAAAILAVALLAAPASAQPIEAWRVTGFDLPESVSYDPGTNTLFVSNVASADMMPNGAGFITQLNLDGTVAAERFVEGLDTPRGTDVREGTLWVAGSALYEIDIATATVVNSFTADGAVFPNDVFAAEDGRVFVTDTFAGAIFVLEDGAFSLWLQDPALGFANGITIVDGTMYVARVGEGAGEFANLQPSNVKTVDLATKAIGDYGSPAGIGGLDGIEPMEGGMLVTDNGGGRLLRVASDGTVTALAEPGAGAADLEYIAAEGLAVVPMLTTGEVVAYRVE